MVFAAWHACGLYPGSALAHAFDVYHCPYFGLFGIYDFTGRDKSQLTMRPAKPLDKFAIACTYMGLVLILGFVYARADAASDQDFENTLNARQP